MTQPDPTSETSGERLRVLCLSPYPAAGPSVRHRIVALAPALATRGIELTLHAFMTDRFYARRRRFGLAATVEKLVHMAHCTLRLGWRLPSVSRYDAVIIHREAFPLGPAWVEALVARLGRRVVYDVDDAVWTPPSNAVDQRRWLASKSRYDAILRACDAVVVGNETLARHAREFNDDVHIIPTGYADPLAATGATEPNPVPVIVWIGNLGNAHYVERVLPALESLAERHAFRLRLIGGDDIDEIRSATVDIERVRWSEAREQALLASADIGIMPLSDAAYDRGKCSFKIVQYFSAALPVVASPVGMNNEIVHVGENGFLPESHADWVASLDLLLSDAARRSRMGRAGRTLYEHGYTYAQNAARWLPLLRPQRRDR